MVSDGRPYRDERQVILAEHSCVKFKTRDRNTTKQDETRTDGLDDGSIFTVLGSRDGLVVLRERKWSNLRFRIYRAADRVPGLLKLLLFGGENLVAHGQPEASVAAPVLRTKQE